MMKKLIHHSLLIVVVFFSFLKSGWTQCEVKGITTNPEEPVNPELPPKTNTFWDWTQEVYNYNLVQSPYPNGNALSPFTINNTNVSDEVDAILLAEDYQPNEGWELIYWDMGLDEDFEPSANDQSFAHFCLYNKYTSILRIFVSGLPPNENYNNIMIDMNVIPRNDSPIPSLLQDPDIFRSFQTHWEQQSISSASDFDSFNEGNWVYADFYIQYDPCVCYHESQISFTFSLIEQSEVDLVSELNAYAKPSAVDKPSDVNNSGTSNSIFTLDYKSIKNGAKNAQKAYKTYKSLTSFSKKQLEILKLDPSNPPSTGFTAEQQKKIDALSDFQRTFTDLGQNSTNLKLGLKAIPKVGTALAIVDMFVGAKGKSTKESDKSIPFTIQGSLKTQGTITTINESEAKRFFTPGSRNSNQLNDRYPYYNELLGVVNVFDLPTARYKRIHEEGEVVNIPFFEPIPRDASTRWSEKSTQEINVTDIIELNGSIKYLINPASGFNTTDIDVMGAIVLNMPYVGEFPVNQLVNPIDSSLYKPLRIFQSEMFQLQCLENGAIEINSLHQRIREFYQNNNNGGLAGNVAIPNDDFFNDYINGAGVEISLKLFFNLERLDNKERVLHVQTYPLNRIDDESLPTANVLNAPQDVHLQNIQLSGDIYGNNITIGPNVTSSSNQLVNIIGVSSVQMQADARLGSNMRIVVNPNAVCWEEPHAPMSQEEVISFCRSESYIQPRLRSSKIEQNAILLEEGIKNSTRSFLEFDLAPNPANAAGSMLYIRTDVDISTEALTLEVVDLQGKIIRTELVTDTHHALSTRGMNKGVYLVKLYSESHQTTVKRLVVSE